MENTTNTVTRLEDQALGIKARKAAAKYLGIRGYKIVETDWSGAAGNVDVVAYDSEGTLVFVKVAVSLSTNGMPSETVTDEMRHQMELVAMDYLAHADREPDVRVRFDNIMVCVFSEDRALIRHHINAFG